MGSDSQHTQFEHVESYDAVCGLSAQDSPCWSTRRLSCSGLREAAANR